MTDTITSVQNRHAKAAKALKTRKGRAASQLFLVEGVKCVQELLAHAPSLVQQLFVREGDDEQIAFAKTTGHTPFIAADHVMSAVCDTKTPQGIAAVARIPEASLPESGFIVALDDVQDPQNVGTIIRTADAAGCAGVVLSAACADHHSPKCVRASMGSLFHLPVVRTDLIEALCAYKQTGCRIACASLDGESEYAHDFHNTCLIIGNESRGVSQAVRALCTDFLNIPMFGKAESLNAAVAAGILIYKIRT